MKTLALICLGLAACFPIGPSLGSSQFTSSPRGAEGWIQLRKTTDHVDVELLMLTDSTYVVQTTDGRIAEAKFTDVRSMKLNGVGFVSGGVTPPKVRERIRVHARFPYEVSDAVRAQLLAKAGQTEFVPLRAQK